MTDYDVTEIKIIRGNYMHPDFVHYWCIDDLNKLNVKTKYHNILNNLKHREIIDICTTNGVIKCIKIYNESTDFQTFKTKYIKHIDVESISSNDMIKIDSHCKLINNIYNLIENTKDRIESKYDKKFNDLFENTSNIIKELKQDLDKKNEKLRELELKVHYLESQIEKKVTIDYEAIKKKNKNLNNEFKRVAKLMKLG